jgi:hypothetical protein
VSAGTFAAVDLGASSGRVMTAHVGPGTGVRGGGVTVSLALDTHGKTLSSHLLAFEIDQDPATSPSSPSGADGAGG